MLASLGRDCRKMARDGEVAALVISANNDGSLKLARSGALRTNAWMATIIRLSLAVIVGFIKVRSMFKGGESGGRAVRSHESHAGAAEDTVYAILAHLGPQSGVALVVCRDDGVRQAVATRAGGRAIDTWNGSRSEFLADLDPVDKNDWVRNVYVELIGNKQIGPPGPDRELGG